MEEIWNLRRVDLFAEVLSNDVDQIIEMMSIGSYRTGEYLFHTGDVAECLYLLQVGTVKVSFITSDGDEKILNIFQAGDIFGELFLGKYRHRIGQAQALEDVVVAKLIEDDFLRLIQRFPKVGLNFIRYLADEQRETLSRMHALMRVDARYRLLGTLLSISRRFCCEEGEWFTLPTRLTQEDIANMAGLNRSTVSLLINEFRRQAVLGGTGRFLTVNRVAIENMLKDAGLEVLE